MNTTLCIYIVYHGECLLKHVKIPRIIFNMFTITLNIPCFVTPYGGYC